MRFSVVTITLNAEKFLTDTLASVAAQTFSDFEHLLWDGGSQDRTLEIARGFPHVRILEGKDKGLSDAMNKAALCAQGEYLLYLHADDILAQKEVLHFVDTALKAHPTLWLYGMASTIDENGKETQKGTFHPFEKKRLEKYNIISHPACFLSRSLFLERGGFDLSLRYCMDYDLWLRCAKVSIPYALPTQLACFRAHEGSLSTHLPREVADEAYLVRNRYLKGYLAKRRSRRTWRRRRESIA